MPINDKPHSTEPVVQKVTDNFGNEIFILTPSWVSYFDAYDTEINVTINNAITTKANASSGPLFALKGEVDKLSRQVKATKSQINLSPQKDYSKDLKRLEAQIAALQAQLSKDHTKDLQEIKAMLARLLREPIDYSKDIKRNEQMNARLLATRQ